MINGYRTLAATGRVLGVSAQQVRQFIEHGPLNGVERPEGLMVHEEDLAAFRRPLGLASSGNNLPPDGSVVLLPASPVDSHEEEGTVVADPLIIGLCAEERWVPVPGSDRHEVSTLGRLRSWKSGKRRQLEVPVDVKPRRIGEGYLGFATQSRLHTAVLEAFVGPCPPGHEVAHRNGDRLDNRLENLRWATHAENIADKSEHGTCSARSKPNLTSEQTSEIRRRWAAGESRAEIAAYFNVSLQTVSNHTRLSLVRG